jgi:hypothetical protein
MPTLEQLPAAAAVNPTDAVLIDQGGNAVTATVAQVLAAVPATVGSTAAGTITLTGDVTGSGTASIVTTLAAITPPGIYEKVTVNAKGQVTAGTTLAATDVSGALGYTPANPANVSAASVTATGSTAVRTLGARAADRINVLDFGADPTGAADSGPAFLAAMNAVVSGGWGQVWVPRGTYKLNEPVNQPSGRSIAVVFDDGADITGVGYLGVDRVEASQGPYRTMQNSGGYFGLAPSVGSPANPPFESEYLFNTPQNSLSMRVGWDHRYTNTNLYGKYHSGIDLAEQQIHSWPNLFDNSSGWGLWEVVSSTTIDEDSMARGGLSSSAELCEMDVVNNGPEKGWTWQSGQGTPVQGMSIDPWGQNGNYGGHLLFTYGTVGGYDGNVAGLNDRWVAYPAAFSTGNPGAVAENATIVITMDLTAQATSTLLGGLVSGVSVTNGGGAYTSAPTVAFSGGGGSGATGTAVMLGGAVVGVTITAAGRGYITSPTVSFAGGGVAAPNAVTVTLNPDGAHGDLTSIAAAVNAAAIPCVRAAVTVWGGVVSRLVIFGTNPSDLGTLTLAGSALATLGISAGSFTAVRGSSAMVMGGTGSTVVGDKLSINGTVVTAGGAGASSDVAAAINAAGISGVAGDVNANGQIVITAWMPASPGGLVLANPSGFSTLAKLGLNGGTFWPPVPPKGFATAAGDATTPVCLATDQISISATDITGKVYGPVIATLNGGDGSAWPTAVAASIQAAVQAGGFYSADFTALSTGSAVVAVQAVGSGGNQGVRLRNTAGGTLTLADANGTPLETLGLTGGTYQPGGYSPGSQTVFMAAEDAIAPRGRGVFVGGASNATDVTTWPGTPLEARGSFLHGLRLDRATINDATALTVAPGHAIAWGTKAQGQTALLGSGGALLVNGATLATTAIVPAATAGQVLTATGTQGVAGTVTPSAMFDAAFGSTYGDMVFRGAAGWVALTPGVTGQALLSGGPGANPAWTTALPAGTHGPQGEFVLTSGTTGLASSLAIGSGFASNAGTLAVAAASATQFGGVVVGNGLTANAGGTLALAGTISGETLNSPTLTGTASNTGTLSGGTLAGSVTMAGTLNGGTLTPATISGGSLAGTITNLGTLSGGTLAGTVTMTGTLSGGTHSGSTLSGTTTNSGTISGGTLAPATISGGSLAGTITNLGTLSGGTLAGTVTMTGTLNGGTLTPATISGGSLAGTITNLGTLAGGTLAGTVTMAGTLNGGTLTPATISGGSLAGTITNNGTLSGGTLAGSVTMAGTLNGGTLTPATISGGSLAGTITNLGTLSGGTLASPNLTGTISNSATETVTGAINATGGTLTVATATAGTATTQAASTGFVAPAFAPLFGTGADGTVTISSGTTTLTRDMCYANLTISGTGQIVTSGFRIFVSGTLNLANAGAGAISNSGNVEGGFVANLPKAIQFRGALATGTGVGTAGLAGYPAVATLSVGGSSGASSGAGGAGTNAGGAAASPQASIGALAQFPVPTACFPTDTSMAGSTYPICAGYGGSSGGGGGGDGTNSGGLGGGGGNGGGTVAIYAQTIQRGANTTAAIIQAKGSNAGNGVASVAGNTGGGGGGAGAGGGFVYIVAQSITGSTIPNAIDVSGGSGGAGGAGVGTGHGGNGGSGGNSGSVQIVNLGVPSFTVSSFNVAGAAGGTTSTTTGGTAGAGATLQVNL